MNQLNMEEMYELLHPSEVKRGMYIVVVSAVKKRIKNTMYGPVELEWEFDGHPLQVLSKALPFIAVHDGEHRYSIDLRECGVVKVHKQYVEARHPSQYFSGKKGSKEKSTKKRCPRCGEKIIQRLRDERGVMLWIEMCKNCGYETPF